MPNIVLAWLELIGTPERAARLLEAPWSCCPSEALFDAAESARIYTNPRYRSALDAWDTGHVVRRDILVWAEHVRSGKYSGPVYLFRGWLVEAFVCLPEPVASPSNPQEAHQQAHQEPQASEGQQPQAA